MTFIACAAMLTSTVILTGCKKEGQNEPQAKVPEVTTDLTISLPANATGGARRMPGTTVQTNNGSTDFQGIGDIKMIPFGLAKSATVVGESKFLGNPLVGITDIASDDALKGKASKAKKYENIAVPTGTSAFLFYGKSKKTGENNEIGYLNYVAGSTNAGQIKFELSPIVNDPATITESAACTGLIAYIQGVANATDGTKAWKNYTASDNEGFKQLFDEYKTTKNLNSFNVQRMMNDLLKSICLNIGTLTDNMSAAIKNTDYVDVADDGKSVTLKTAYANFPGSFGIPDGSVAVAYNEDDGTFGVSTDKAFANRTSGELNVAPVEKYAFPSALWYYANTTLYTSNQSQATALANTENNWSWVLTQYGAGNANTSVNSKTRSIALTSPINYAVGRLDVKVKLNSANLNDNATPSAASIVCNNKFQLAGVLIGGQRNVGFDFTPDTYPTTSPVYTIYDNQMTSTINVTTEYGAANSTLVLETYADDAAATDNDDVIIAIELINNTESDFIGADGVIPNGGKFYMVGKLTAASAETTPKKVFLKDYITTAQLNIVDLTKAYNTIPDLRTPTLEIGLSVDLSWTAGTTYTVDL